MTMTNEYIFRFKEVKCKYTKFIKWDIYFLLRLLDKQSKDVMMKVGWRWQCSVFSSGCCCFLIFIFQLINLGHFHMFWFLLWTVTVWEKTYLACLHPAVEGVVVKLDHKSVDLGQEFRNVFPFIYLMSKMLVHLQYELIRYAHSPIYT